MVVEKVSRDNVVEAVFLWSLPRIEKMSKELRFSASGRGTKLSQLSFKKYKNSHNSGLDILFLCSNPEYYY